MREFAFDGEGRLWVVDWDREVLRWNAREGEWDAAGLFEARKIAAGPEGQVYALADPKDKQG